MPQRFKWDPFTGIMEALPEEPKPTPQIPAQMAADYADAESKTKAFLDAVHAKEKRYLEAYEKMHGVIQNARTPESRQIAERHFDLGHQNTVKYRDEEVRNRDTAVKNLWSVFAEKWPGTTCKLVTAAEQMSGKTYRTVEIESPYLGKRGIGPTTVPEARYLIDETKGGFRALARQPQGFLPQGYVGEAPSGFGHPPSASRPGLDRDLSYADYDRIRRARLECSHHGHEPCNHSAESGAGAHRHIHDHFHSAGLGPAPHGHHFHHHFTG